MKHPFHAEPEIVARLKRAAGHLAKVIDMMEEGRPCLELAQQLQAVEHAITNAKRALVQHHIEECLDETAWDDPKVRAREIRDFKAITKYL